MFIQEIRTNHNDIQNNHHHMRKFLQNHVQNTSYDEIDQKIPPKMTQDSPNSGQENRDFFLETFFRIFVKIPWEFVEKAAAAKPSAKPAEARNA